MDDPSFWKEAAKYLWGLLVPAGWWIFKKQDDRLTRVEEQKAHAADVKELKDAIHSLRNRMVTKEDFARHEADDKADRAERREAEISLFNKVDELKDSVNNKFDAIKDLLLRR